MTRREPAAENAPRNKWFRASVYMRGLGAFPAEVTLQPPPRRPGPRFTPAVMADVARAWHRMHQHSARRGVPEAVWDLAFARGEIVVHDYAFPDRSEATAYTETRIGIEDDGFYHFGCGALPWTVQPGPWPTKQRDLARILADTEARALHAAFLAAEDTPYSEKCEVAYRRLAYTLLALGTPIPHLPEALDALAADAQGQTAAPDPAPRPAMRKAPAMSSDILDLAREFGRAAARFNDVLPTARAGGRRSVWCVTADENPLPREVHDELLETLSTVTWNLAHGVVYLERTARAHGDPDGVAEALRGMHGLLAHLAATLSATTTEIAQDARNAESASEDDIRAIAENALSTAAANAEHAPGYPASWLLLNEADLIHSGRPLSAMDSAQAEQEAYRLATRLAVSALGQALAARERRESVAETLRRAAALLKP